MTSAQLIKTSGVLMHYTVRLTSPILAPQTHHRQERNLSRLIFLFLHRLFSSAPPETQFWQDVTLREWEVAACELIFSTERWWRSNGVFRPDKTTTPLLLFFYYLLGSHWTRSHLALRKIGFFFFFFFAADARLDTQCSVSELYWLQMSLGSLNSDFLVLLVAFFHWDFMSNLSLNKTITCGSSCHHHVCEKEMRKRRRRLFIPQSGNFHY